MDNGWITLHRKIQENPVVMKDTDHLAVWIYLLLNATHKEYDVIFKGKRIKLKPGELITGRKAICKNFKNKVSESKVQRILKIFESEQQIEQQTSSEKRLIKVNNWNQYQQSEQQSEQQVNNNRTTSEQQVNTNNNDNNVNNINITTSHEEEIKGLIKFWNEIEYMKDCRGVTDNLKQVYKKIRKGKTKEEFEECISIAITNYVKEIKERNPNSDYSKHRFSLYEFLKQSNGYQKFLNA